MALVAFTASLCLGWTTVGHLGPADDAECGAVEVAAGHAGSQFEAVKASLPASHCAFCHWQRAVSGANLAALTSGIFQLQLVDRFHATPVDAALAPVRDPHTSRGPPALV